MIKLSSHKTFGKKNFCKVSKNDNLTLYNVYGFGLWITRGIKQVYRIHAKVHTKQGEKTHLIGKYKSKKDANKALFTAIQTIEAGLYSGEEIISCEIEKIWVNK